MSTETLLTCIDAVHEALMASEADIEKLDRAIGDGDHFINMKRGIETIAAMREELAPLTPDLALKAIAMKLLSTIGGASGPLISSFFLAMSKQPGADKPLTAETVAAMFQAGVEAIKTRGKADVGDKTMLDVLVPVSHALSEGVAAGESGTALRDRLKSTAEQGMLATRDILAKKGRAAFLGERAIGHIDPGAMSSTVIIRAVCDATA